MVGPDTPSQAQRVGRYHLIERLAIGGMAEVFLACQRGEQSLDRLVVLKRILPHLAQNPEFVEAFTREANITARIRHPNVVQIFELGEAGGLPFIAMEYVPGSTLKQLVVCARQAQERLPLETCVHLLAQCCAGVHAAHELADPHGKPYGLVHRDVSPHNLMVDDSAHVKLLDFGIAKASGGMDHTRTGMLKGKISYMSPEQCRQERLDRRSDLFAIGVVGFELLTGQRPFTASSELATMQAIVAGRSTPIRDLRPDLSEELAAVVARAMAPRPEDRPATADELRRELKQAFGREIDEDRAALVVRTLLGERHAVRRKAVEEALERTLVTFSGHPAPEGPLSARDLTSESIAPTAPTAAPDPAAPEPSDGGPRRSLARRILPLVAACALALAVLGLAGMVALAAWLGGGAGEQRAAFTGDPVVVLVAPVVDSDRMAADNEPIRAYLERKLRRPVTFTISGTYEEAADGVLGGAAPFAYIPRGTVLYALKKDPGVRVLAVKVVDGSASTDGYLLVRREASAPATVADVKGRTVCLADPLSTTGWRLPRQFLAASGLDLDHDVTFHVSGNHEQVLLDLLDGVCDVGATYSENLNTAAQRGIATARLRLLAVTGTSAHDGIVAGSHADPKLARALTDALLAFDPERDAGVARVGESEPVTGFVAPPKDYATPDPAGAPSPPGLAR